MPVPRFVGGPVAQPMDQQPQQGGLLSNPWLKYGLIAVGILVLFHFLKGSGTQTGPAVTTVPDTNNLSTLSNLENAIQQDYTQNQQFQQSFLNWLNTQQPTPTPTPAPSPSPTPSPGGGPIPIDQPGPPSTWTATPGPVTSHLFDSGAQWYDYNTGNIIQGQQYSGGTLQFSETRPFGGGTLYRIRTNSGGVGDWGLIG